MTEKANIDLGSLLYIHSTKADSWRVEVFHGKIAAIAVQSKTKPAFIKLANLLFVSRSNKKTRHKNLEDGYSTRGGYFTPKRISCRYWTNDPYIKYACTTPFTFGCLGVVESKWLVGSLFVCDRCDALWRKIDNRIKIPSSSFVSL